MKQVNPINMKNRFCFYLNLGIIGVLIIFSAVSIGDLLDPSTGIIERIKKLIMLSLLISLLLALSWFSIKTKSGNHWPIFLLLLTGLIICEITLRLCFPNYEKQDEILYRYPRPYYQFSGKPNSHLPGNPKMLTGNDHSSDVILNEDGFRIEQALILPKPAEEIRILMVGGSTVFNGNPLCNSIPGYLESLCHQNDWQHIKVYNLGVVSFVSGQELALLLHKAIAYQPDLVIVYDGGNDIFEPYIYDPRPGYPYNFLAYEEGFFRLQGKPWTVTQIGLTLLNNIRVISALSGARFAKKITRRLKNELVDLETVRKECGYRTTAWSNQVVQTYINNLELMCGLARGFDFKIIFALQPIVHLKHPLVGNEGALLGDIPFQDYLKSQYLQVRVKFAELSVRHQEENQCFFIDLSGIMEGYDRDIYWDFIHTNNEGNRYIAAKLFDFIDANQEQLQVYKID